MADIISISDMRTGLQKDVHTFLRARDGFSQIVNFYPFRGRMERRRGAKVIGRLVAQTSTTLAARSSQPQTYAGTLTPVVEEYSVTFSDTVTTYADNGSGLLIQSSPALLTITGITKAANAVITLSTASPYNAGDMIYVMNVVGMTQINNVPLTVVSSAGNNVTVTLNSTTFSNYISGGIVGYYGGTVNYYSGSYNVVYYTPVPGGSPAVTVTYSVYGKRPVMGLPTRNINVINAIQTIAFDTVKANVFSNTNQGFQDITFYKNTGTAFSWTGTDIDFFDSTNYEEAFFTTNNVNGVHYLPVTSVTKGATTTVTFTGGDLFQNGDYVTLNLVVGFTGTINGLVGTVASHASGSVVINIDTSSLGGSYSSGGVIQLLTRSLTGTGNGGDGIRWYDGTGWVNFQPVVSTTQVLTGALGVVPYKGYMIALRPTLTNLTNTSTITSDQGVLWSQVGTIYTNALVPTDWRGGYDPNAWNQNALNGAGFTNAATSEILMGWEFLKDTLLIKFERSSWNLRYTWDPNNPFIFEKISSDFGSESTQSMISFDDFVFTVGNYGITKDTVASVGRIDEKIPDEVFNINNDDNGAQRVYGIRDYVKQLVYWTYPLSTNNLKYPNNILVYNYLDGSWGKFQDYVTCFGYFQPFNDVTWGDLNIPWSACDFTWGSGATQSRYPTIIGGNQQGFVFQFNNDQVTDDPTLAISGITQASPCVVTITNHNLNDGDFIQISGVLGMTEINANAKSPYGVYCVGAVLSVDTIELEYVDLNVTSTTYGQKLPLDSTTFGTYTANTGFVAIDPDAVLQTKTFSPYLEEGIKCRLSNVDLFMQATGQGEMTLDYFINQNLSNPVAKSTFQFTSTTGQNYVWRRLISNISGQFVTVQLGFSNVQRATPTSYQMSVALQIMNLSIIKSGRFILGQNL